MQARSPAVASEPTERESAGLVIAALLHEVEKLRVWAEAEIAVLQARVCQLEESNATDQDRPPRLDSNWKTITQISFESGYAESTIRKWRDAGKIVACPHGGRWLIDARTVPVKPTHRSHLS